MKPIFKYKTGFTLVEILIVGALIALFAAFAIINIQQYFKDTLRKVAIAEVHQIATASSFASDDVAFFPKFCYLNQSLNGLYNLMRPLGPGAGNTIPPDLEYMGYSIAGRLSTVVNKWKGSYFAFAQTRGRVSQGRGGEVRVELPGTGLVVRWPADPWGNPYVLYSMYIDEDGNHSFVTRIGQEPNFFNAVVSYGYNGVPGSNEEHLAVNPLLKTTLEQARLYEPSSRDDAVFRMLLPVEYFTPGRIDAYSKKDSSTTDNIGIIDPGSDDLFYEF